MLPALLLDKRALVVLLVAAFLALQIWAFVHYGITDRPDGGERPTDCSGPTDGRVACYR